MRTRAGVLAGFLKNPDGDMDGPRLADGTEVRSRLDGNVRPGDAVKLNGRVTIRGWTNPGEREPHADTITTDPVSFRAHSPRRGCGARTRLCPKLL